MNQAARAFIQPAFKTRQELEAMITEMDRKLDVLYQNANALSRPIIWANLTNAVLKLLAPEDQEYAYERLYSLFKSHQQRSGNATPTVSADRSAERSPQ
ncbi:hypothetical protein [Pseudoxanthomonas indica]|uniref:Uncharacterized protein n=1 Tax=Pseudoxanthomonas indica TaxID=428993 RepID=A0A1T5LMU5_9GAMM|nr:hypothetical protein [Pseudoxanthomonas indica]GGD37061.1 hypothetical protein GCM10007235_06440 [Pseudoxanthomonas indica]SKC77244.1 hypothetical protein SAMN06296058_2766 [Pseudoxanthomonas indica]